MVIGYEFVRLMKNKFPSAFYLASAVKDYFRYRFCLVSKVPHSLMIETSNTCNLRCTMCSTKDSKRKKGSMSMDMYRRIIDDAADSGVRHIALHTVGEPLMHRNIVDMIRIAKKKGLYVMISTNGQLLTPEKSKELISSRLDMIRFSLEGYEKKLYESIRVGGNFDRLVKNLRDFKAIRKSMKKNKPWMEINSVLIKEDINYAKKFYRFWKPMVDLVKFSVEANQAGYSPHKIHPSLRKYFTSREPCHLLWGTMSISWNGDVTACCIDFENKLKVGDIRNHTIKQVWNSKTYFKMRKNHINGRFGAMPLCGPCDGRCISEYKVHKLNKKIEKAAIERSPRKS
ncbi:radical SAM protein [Candidatus Woesearchaeota archaeon]|nr:radical SAM protein [Candidatus Woesearchaeota archaeon]